jgi:hypothetical protein
MSEKNEKEFKALVEKLENKIKMKIVEKGKIRKHSGGQSSLNEDLDKYGCSSRAASTPAPLSGRSNTTSKS